LPAAAGLQLACLLAAGKRRTQDDSAQTANPAVRAAGNTRLVKFLVDNHFL
jgi:hypothetical protein